MMEKFQQDFIDLISCALFDRKCKNADCEFEKTEKLAVSHYCLPLVYYGAVLSGLNPPQTWKDASLIVGMNNYKKLLVQNKVIEFLKENKIPCAVIKGTSAAVNYKNPTYRPLGDVDILINECDYEKTMKLFKQMDKENKHKFHFSFTYEGVSIEIHKSIDDLDNCKNGSQIASIMKDALNDVQYLMYDGFEFPALKNKYQAIVYLIHMVRHFNDNELSMRMFCDWVCFINSLSDDAWNNEIYTLIDKCGYQNFADALNLAAQKYMNLKIGNKMICDIGDRVVDLLMEDFVFEDKAKSENFLNGNIASLYSKYRVETGSVFKSTVKVLNDLSYRNFKASKYKIVLPFCWIYLLLRYLMRLLLGKRNRLSYKKVNDITKRRTFIKKELSL